MEINSLRCNHCSANLEIIPKIKFFTCTYCGSSLTIKSSGNVLYTEVIDEIKDNTNTLIDQNKRLLKEQEIERLDRDWEREREHYKITGENGAVRYPDQPDTGGKLIGCLTFLVAIFVLMNFFISRTNGFTNNSGIIAFFVIVIVAGAIVSMILNDNKEVEYKTEKDKYLAKRQALLDALNEGASKAGNH